MFENWCFDFGWSVSNSTLQKQWLWQLKPQAQPPTTLTARPFFEDWSVGPSRHKWLGCIFSTANASKRQDDIKYRLKCAVRAFHVHKRILCDKMVSMASRLTYFQAMITSAVCFAAGKAKCIQSIFENFRCIAGNCADVFWVHPWHTILHGTSCMVWPGRHFSRKKLGCIFNNRYWNIASPRAWFGFFNYRTVNKLARWNKLWATARSFVSRQVCDQDVCSLVFCSATQWAMKNWRAWAEE